MSVVEVDSGLRSWLLGGVAQRWQERADAIERGEASGSAAYARARVEALARPVTGQLAGCGRMGRLVSCACPGERPRWFGCRQHWLCRTCRRGRCARLARRLKESLPIALERSHVPGQRRRHKIILITLTIGHSGDLTRDRAELAAGWRRFYKAAHERWGAFPYAGVWEVTTGRDGLGHVHAHVAAVWGWRDWRVVRRMWLAACPRSARISLVASSTPARAAGYLAKYLSKGVDTADFTPELRARVSAAMYNARSVFTSRSFWLPWKPLCPVCCTPVQVRMLGWSRVYTCDQRMATGPPDPDERASVGHAGSGWLPAPGFGRCDARRFDHADPVVNGWVFSAGRSVPLG